MTLFYLLLSLLSGGAIALSFPSWELYPLAWIAFVPLFFAIRNQPISRAFLMGWLAGLAYFGGTLSWVTISMQQYGGLSGPTSFAIMLLLTAYLALYVGTFCALCQWGGRHFSPMLTAPVFWVALEFTRGQLLSGFPWGSLGYSQYRLLPFIQIADIGSVYAISFLLMGVNAALYQILQMGWHEKRLAWKEGGLALFMVIGAFTYGAFRLNQTMQGPKALATAVIQGNIPQDQKWDETFKDQTMVIYDRLSQRALQTKPLDLVLWPESAAPFFFQTETYYQIELSRMAREGKFHLLFGSPAFEPAPYGRITLRNSAYFLSPETHLISRYDKMHLVPFGEYVPLSSVLFFVNKMVEGIGNFIPGEEITLMEANGVKVGAVICFEVIFPELVRRFVAHGARVMTTLTNDAWFGDSAAPDQHFSMVVFRAIENRVPFARAANTGISGFIDAHGHILQSSPLFVEAALTASLYEGMRTTFYTAYGDLFAIACVILAITFIGLIRRRNRHDSGT